MPKHLSEFFSVLEAIDKKVLRNHTQVLITCMSCLGKYYEARCRAEKALYFTVACTLLVRLASKSGMYFHIEYTEKRFVKKKEPLGAISTLQFIEKVAEFLEETKLPLICFTDAELAKADIFTRWTLPPGLTQQILGMACVYFFSTITPSASALQFRNNFWVGAPMLTVIFQGIGSAALNALSSTFNVLQGIFKRE